MNRKTKVLIVDDDPGILMQLRWALRDDFDLLLAGSPREVEQLLRDVPSLDAAVVDLHLPPDATSIDGGLSVIRAVRQAGRDTRIIAISADRALGLARRAEEAGASTLLGKPVERDRLLVLLRKADEEDPRETEGR